jgi:hypothetical protein
VGAHAHHAPGRRRSGRRPRRLIHRLLPLLAATALALVATPAAAQPATTEPDVLQDLGFQEAWATTTGEGVVVAVLDTGIDPAPDVLPTIEVADGTTAESGTSAARLVQTAAPGARVLPVRVLDDDGDGTAQDLAAGIAAATEAHAGVIALTLAGDADALALLRDGTVQQAMRAAVGAGSVVVAGGSDDVTLPDDLAVVLVPDDVSAGDVTPLDATALVAGAAALLAGSATPEEIGDALVDTAQGTERTLDAAAAVERVSSTAAGGGQVPPAGDLEGGLSPGTIGLVVFGAALTAVVGTIWLGSRRPRQPT